MQATTLAPLPMAPACAHDSEVTVDLVGCRVKTHTSQIFEDEQTVKRYLHKAILANRGAMSILDSPNGRFTSRIVAPHNQIKEITPFKIHAGLVVKEEARIKGSEYDVIYIGGNGFRRFEPILLRQEWQLARKCNQPHPQKPVGSKASFQRLRSVTTEDLNQLAEIYCSCFRSRLKPLDEVFFQDAVQNSIFYVARNYDGVIIASAIGEIVQLGPVIMLEITKVVSHPKLRLRGVATECARLVVKQATNELPGHAITFMESRMWTNILQIGQNIGLTNLAGVCHQDCSVSSPEEMISIPQAQYHSLAIYYQP